MLIKNKLREKLIEGNYVVKSDDLDKIAPQIDKKDPDAIIKVIDEVETNESLIWPKSKLSQQFELILSDELRKTFKGMFYVVDYTIYYNEKPIMTIDPDLDNVNTIIQKLKSKINPKVSENINPKMSKKDLVEVVVKHIPRVIETVKIKNILK